jgi:hypothetical protein
MNNATYACHYCRQPHNLSTRSVEHIIPEALGNLTLKLPDVCKYWNNFFAASFEMPVTNFEFTQAVLREYGLKKVRGVQQLEEVTTARGTTEYVWSVSGKELLRDRPVRARKNTIDYPALDANGNQQTIQITLPFEYLVGTTGDETERADATTKTNRDMKRLLDYLPRLARDPSIDPALALMLQKRQLTLPVPKSVDYDISAQHVSDGEAVNDIDPKAHALDIELWSKFYLKVGWCFASLKLGAARLATIEDPEVLRLLKGGVVAPSLVALCASEGPAQVDRLFREATPNGVQVWFWRRTIRETDEVVPTLPPTLEPFVRMAHEQRKVDAMRVKTWVNFLKPGTLDRKAARPSAADRFHRVRLEKIVRGDHAALGCSITLFGGVFEVVTQLSPLVSPDSLAGIEVEEEVRLPAARS